jgi:regulator of protease activity HflC (stomatin/prohibitin superfamily)
MYWSDFSDASLAKSSAETREKVPVTRIDLRVRKAFYSYSVRSSDNVKLQLDGSVFWQITDVQRMVAATSDPEGDLWYHARSSIIQAVSNVTLNTFMSNFNAIVLSAFTGASSDTFYIERGIELQSIELTSYECIDTDTAIVLQEIIRESTYRRNRLIMQGSEDDVRKEKLNSDIMIEGKRTALLETLADNNLLIARTSGETDGARTAKSISSFIDGLNLSLPELDDRVSLYKHHNALESSKNDTTNLATGTANLYVAPKDMNLKLSMPGGL